MQNLPSSPGIIHHHLAKLNLWFETEQTFLIPRKIKLSRFCLNSAETKTHSKICRQQNWNPCSHIQYFNSENTSFQSDSQTKNKTQHCILKTHMHMRERETLKGFVLFGRWRGSRGDWAVGNSRQNGFGVGFQIDTEIWENGQSHRRLKRWKQF